MTVDPGSASLQGGVDWTKFTDSGDIPEWISTAYADTYQGPHAAAVGEATTKAVVTGITAIIASDGIFAVITNALHI